MSVSDKQMNSDSESEVFAPLCTFAVQREKTWLDGRTHYEYVPEPLRFKAMKILPTDLIEARKTKHLDLLKKKNTKKCGFSSIKEQNESYYRQLRRDTNLKINVLTRAKHGWGRVSGSDACNFACLERFSRNTLLNDYYLDFDIEKCQASIILGAATDEKEKCDALREYCQKRDAILTAGMEKHGKSRDEIKEAWTALMNGGGVPKWYESTLAHRVEKECKQIRLRIKQANPELFESMRQKTKNDPEKMQKYGGNEESITEAALRSMMSIWFQQYEVKCVASVLEFCEKEGLLTLEGDAYKDKLIFGYIYDGFVLLKSAVEKWCKRSGQTVEMLLGHFEDIVAEKIGFELVWKVKEFKELYDIGEQMISVMAAPKTSESIKLTGDMSFSRMAEEFEKTNCKIRDVGCYVETNERTGTFTIRSLDKLKHSYAHLWCGYDDKGKKVNFIDTWTKNNDEIRIYDTLNVYPNPAKCPPHEFNLWMPFAMERVEASTYRQDVLELFQDFIKCTICGHLPHHTKTPQYDYMIKWMAHLFQKPEKKIGKCPILISKFGSGKGTFYRIMQRLMGAKKIFQSHNPARDVFGDFNPMMEDAMLVFLDEAGKGKISAEAQETFKGFITEGQMTVRNLYVPPHVIWSNHAFVITTNQEDGGVFLTEGDRRFFVLRMSDSRGPDVAYWNKWHGMLDDMEDDSPWKTIYDWLMIQDLSGDWLKNTPKTEYQKNLETSSKTPIDAWLEDMTTDWRRQKGKSEVEMKGDEVLASFIGFCERNGFNRKEYQTNSGGLSAKLNNHEISKWGGEKEKGWRATEVKRGGSNNHRVFRLNEMWNFYVEKGRFRDEDFNECNEDSGSDEDSAPVLPEPVEQVKVKKPKIVIKQVKGQTKLGAQPDDDE